MSYEEGKRLAPATHYFIYFSSP